MHILILSNLYPPHVIGGYEMACGKAAGGLAARGHTVSVLTSTHGVGAESVEGGIYRLLRIDMEADAPSANPIARIFGWLKAEKANQRAVRKVLSLVKPDLVYVWNPRFVPNSCLGIIRKSGIPVSFYVFDHWMRHLERDNLGRLARALKAKPMGGAMLAVFKGMCRLAGLEEIDEPIRFAHAHFATAFLQREAHKLGIRADHEERIYWGLESMGGIAPKAAPTGRLLYVGQLVPHKGVHMALEGLRIVLDRGADASLSLAGAGNPEYRDELERTIDRLDLAGRVRWLGMRTAAQLETDYADHDILVFPSLWEEPFGITQLGAMRDGLAVVSSGTGGAAEIIEHGVNGMTYPKDDPSACAECILGLLKDPDAFARITGNAKRTLAGKFAFGNTIMNMDESLSKLAASRAAGGDLGKDRA